MPITLPRSMLALFAGFCILVGLGIGNAFAAADDERNPIPSAVVAVSAAVAAMMLVRDAARRRAGGGTAVDQARTDVP